MIPALQSLHLSAVLKLARLVLYHTNAVLSVCTGLNHSSPCWSLHLLDSRNVYTSSLELRQQAVTVESHSGIKQDLCTCFRDSNSLVRALAAKTTSVASRTQRLPWVDDMRDAIELVNVYCQSLAALLPTY